MYVCVFMCICAFVCACYSWLKLNPARGNSQTLLLLLLLELLLERLLLLLHLRQKVSGVFTHVDDVDVFAH